MVTLRQLQYFVDLAETGSFRGAARKSHVSQPTLSVQVKALEHGLGVQLVERGGNGLVITPLGEDILQRARRILADVEDLKERAASSQHGLTGTVRLGVLPTIGAYLMPQVVPELQQRYPDLALYVREEIPQALLERLEAGRLDLVLTALPVDEGLFEIDPLIREPLFVAVPKKHRFAERKDLARSDLKGERVLALEPGHRLFEQVRDLCADYGAELLRDYEGTSLDTLRQMVSMGLGISFLPALYVQSEIPKQNDVRVLPLRNRQPTRTVALVWRKRSAFGDYFRALGAVMRERLSVYSTDIFVLSPKEGR